MLAMVSSKISISGSAVGIIGEHLYLAGGGDGQRDDDKKCLSSSAVNKTPPLHSESRALFHRPRSHSASHP